jgi:histidine triad (HIT) family protein
VLKKCVFCQILDGELAADFVYRDSEVAAFLDNRPLFPGHVLIVPTVHRETLGDLYPQELTAVYQCVRLMSRAVPKALGAEGSFTANNNVVSQSVPHLHVHVIPRSRKDGLKGFFWPRVPYRDNEHSQEAAAAIRAAYLEEMAADERRLNQEPA